MVSLKERKKERLTNGHFFEQLVLAYTMDLMNDLGCDTLTLQTLFVYFLALPSLLHSSIFFIQLISILITVLF